MVINGPSKVRLDFWITIEELGKRLNVEEFVLVRCREELVEHLRATLPKKAKALGGWPLGGIYEKKVRKWLAGMTDPELCKAFAAEWDDDVPPRGKPKKPQFSDFVGEEEFLQQASRMAYEGRRMLVVLPIPSTQ